MGHSRKAVPLYIALVANLCLCIGMTSAQATGDAIAEEELQIPPDAAEDRVIARPVTISDLLTLRNIGEMGGGGLRVSPDGKWLAFEAHQANVAENTYRVEWFVASSDPGGTVVQVGDGGDPTLFRNRQGGWGSQAPQWSRDNEWIAYLRKENGAVQVWRSRWDGSVQEQLTRNQADVGSFGWSNDGRRIYFSTDAPREAIAVAERQDAAAGYLVDDKEFNGFYSVQPIRPPYRLTDGTPKRWIYELDTRDERVAGAEEWAEYEVTAKSPTLTGRPLARAVSFSSGDRKVAWLENRQPEVYQGFLAPLTVFASPDPDGDQAEPCTATECTGRIQDVWWNGEDEVIFVRVESGRWGLYAWLPASGEVRRVLTTYDWVSDCTVIDGRAICFWEGPATPRRIVTIDLGCGTVTTLVEPNPEWAAIQLGEVERLEWANEFGQPGWGYLIKPLEYETSKRYPLVIIQYDARSCLRGGTGDEFPTHLFAARGIAVLCVSGTGEDRELLEKEADPYVVFRASYEGFAKHRQALASLQAAIDLLDRRGVVDPRRVGITGLSAGVETLQYALIHSKAFAAAATAGGGMEPMSYYGSTRESREQIFDAIGFGDVMQGQGENWRGHSLSLNAREIDIPLLIHAADREYLHALQTVVTWKRLGKPIEMFVFPDEYHVKWQPVHRYHVYRRNVDWFSFWLQDYEDPDPGRSEQYARWRGLRMQRDIGSSAPESARLEP